MNSVVSFGRVTIVLVWLCLLYIHYRAAPRSDGHLDSAAPVVATQSAAGGDEHWMGLYLGDRKVGYSYGRTAKESERYLFEERSLLRMNVLGSEQTVHAIVHGVTGSDFALQSFTVSVHSGVGVLDAEGTVGEDAIDLRLRTGGEETRQQIPIKERVFLPALAREELVRAGLKAGQEVTLRVFDTSAMQAEPMQLTVIGREGPPPAGTGTALWHVRERFRGIESEVWLDQDGNAVREKGPLGLVAIRETAAQALSGWSTTQALDLIAAVAVPVQRDIVEPRSLAHLTVRLHGTQGVSVPSDARQHLDGSTLVVAREVIPLEASYQLPYGSERWQAELAASPFVQVNHPRIRSAAAEALAGETDPRAAAERLRQWVFARLEKRPIASIPNALQALSMGAGDCNEHAVLYAALARAAGIPTRMVAGVVYADGAFLYHAWNEVWLGSTWVSVDSSMDQMPVDATHIKLIEGGPESHVGLVPLIGQLSIDVVSTG